MPILHTKRAKWLREITAADTNCDREAAKTEALAATDRYFRNKHVTPNDVAQWDTTLAKLSAFAEQVAPGKMALVHEVLKPPVNSRFHGLQQRREAFSRAMREGDISAAADHLAHLQRAGWDKLGVVSGEAAADHGALFAAISARKTGETAVEIADACTLLARHVESIEQRAATHPSRLELPALRRWLSKWLSEAYQAASSSQAFDDYASLQSKLIGERATSGPEELAQYAADVLTGAVHLPQALCKNLAVAGIVNALLHQDAWEPLLSLHDKIANLPIGDVPCLLTSFRAWRPNRDIIALYSDILCNNPEATNDAHPAMHEKLRFMRYLEGPAQSFSVTAGSTVVASDDGDDVCANLTEYIKQSVKADHRALLYLHIQNVSVLFHGEHQQDRIGVFFGNLRDAYATALTQASKRATDDGNNTVLRDLLVALRPYCGDGQLTQLHEALVSMNQSELRVPIMEKHFNTDERVGEHLRNFWTIQRERYARSKGGFDPDNLSVGAIARIEADPDYQAHYNNKSSFAIYMRMNWPDFVHKYMEVGDQPPSFFDRLLRQGAASRAARAAEFERRLDHQINVFAVLEPDPQ